MLGIRVLQDGRPAELARRLLAEGEYQVELPAAPVESEPSPLLERLLEALGWTGLAAVAAVLAILIVLAVRAVVARFQAGTLAEEELEVGAPRAALDLEDPERLAAGGAYGEAIHALLLHAIHRLSAGLAEPPAPSATARELLPRLTPPGERREALRALVGRVELWLFGGLATGADEWAASRAHYRIATGEELE